MSQHFSISDKVNLLPNDLLLKSLIPMGRRMVPLMKKELAKIKGPNQLIQKGFQKYEKMKKLRAVVREYYRGLVRIKRETHSDDAIRSYISTFLSPKLRKELLQIRGGKFILTEFYRARGDSDVIKTIRTGLKAYRKDYAWDLLMFAYLRKNQKKSIEEMFFSFPSIYLQILFNALIIREYEDKSISLKLQYLLETDSNYRYIQRKIETSPHDDFFDFLELLVKKNNSIESIREILRTIQGQIVEAMKEHISYLKTSNLSIKEIDMVILKINILLYKPIFRGSRVRSYLKKALKEFKGLKLELIRESLIRILESEGNTLGEKDKRIIQDFRESSVEVLTLFLEEICSNFQNDLEALVKLKDAMSPNNLWKQFSILQDNYPNFF